MKLTRKQNQTFDLIANYIAKNGFSPTYSELMALMGVKSKNAVSKAIFALIRKGYIIKSGVKARTIRIVDK